MVLLADVGGHRGWWVGLAIVAGLLDRELWSSGRGESKGWKQVSTFASWAMAMLRVVLEWVGTNAKTKKEQEHLLRRGRTWVPMCASWRMCYGCVWVCECVLRVCVCVWLKSGWRVEGEWKKSGRRVCEECVKSGWREKKERKRKRRKEGNKKEKEWQK